MQINLTRSELEQQFHDIFGETDAFGGAYSKQDIDNWFVDLLESEKAEGNEVVIN